MFRSQYYLTLDDDIKRRYEEKLEIIDNIDPYTLTENELNQDLTSFPTITFVDLVCYFIYTHSFYTKQQLKAHKSLQAYKYYEAGFVCGVFWKEVNENAFVVVGKVKHSQKMRDKNLDVWVIVLKDGSISSGHCTCMAGLGEVCSHVAAILFYFEARPTEETACTDELSKWPVPATRNPQMMRVRDMDWAKNKKKKVQTSSNVPEISDDELIRMIAQFEEDGHSPAIARIVEPFASKIAKENAPPPLPEPLDSIYREDFAQKSYFELLAECENLHSTMSDEDISTIEKVTRNQAKCHLWYKYRVGRITASKFKSSCRASLEKPPLSLIKSICYPHKVTFYSKQTSYGIENEKKALNGYLDEIKKHHQGVTLNNVGFCISGNNAVFGGSPDGIVNCLCCGMGCVEVKCPFTLQEITLQEFINKKNSFLKNDNGTISLKRDHSYYFQIQLQMYVTNCKYSDFIVWSSHTLFIERVQFEEEFCLQNMELALKFHKYVLQPELLGRFFTAREGRSQTWCLCGSIADDNYPLIKCGNVECRVKWYHMNCIGMTEITDVPWFCEECQ